MKEFSVLLFGNSTHVTYKYVCKKSTKGPKVEKDPSGFFEVVSNLGTLEPSKKLFNQVEQVTRFALQIVPLK
jgi:hypothetical protein